ncbi:MAG: lytic transglycosylase domain-containing protein [Candidatus Aminicenantes bacterium]|nr:lytic transglycosylase domain-containing protein [Candidatus Aminicenantes bacterium]
MVMRGLKKNWLILSGIFLGLFLMIFPCWSAGTNFRQEINRIVEEIAHKYSLEPTLIHSIIKIESNYDPWAISPKGAIGLMQLMPTTAAQYGVRDIFDPRENIEGGVRYLKDLIRLYQGRTDLVLAAYNVGQEAVKKFGGIPPYPETINYIEKVKASYNKPVIRTRTRIYKFIDKKGRVVLTNDRQYYLKNRRDN